MKIYYAFTNAKNGGFGVLGKGIRAGLDNDPRFEVVNDDQCNFPDMLNKEAYKKIPQVDIILTYGMPDLVPYARMLKKIQKNKPIHVHYAVWESSELPPRFISAYKKVDRMLTSTEYTAKNMRKSGLSPMVWHHGIDERFKYTPRKDDGVFTFLHHNGYEYRKGWELVILAFSREFAVEEPVKLVIKARERKHGVWILPKQPPFTPETLALFKADKEAYLQKVQPMHPNIIEKIGHVTDEELVEINNSADCFVFPAKGEGWGLPPFEAMAMGIVPILPNKGCFTEWFNPYTMLDVKVAGYLHAAPRYPGYMFECSVRDLRKQMRWAYEHQKELAEMGAVGSEYIHENYNWHKIIDELHEILSAFI